MLISHLQSVLLLLQLICQLLNIFSVIHYSVQSLFSEVHQLQIALSHFDIIALRVTWLSPSTKNDDIAYCRARLRRAIHSCNNFDSVYVRALCLPASTVRISPGQNCLPGFQNNFVQLFFLRSISAA